MRPIVKTFTGINLDLSTIIAIHDAKFDIFNHRNRFAVYFDIYCANRPEPFRYERELTHDEQQAHDHFADYYMIAMIDGTFEIPTSDEEQLNQKNILAVARLQAQIDELIEQWRTA